MIYLDANVIIRFVEGDLVAAGPVGLRLSAEKEMLTSQLSRLECRCHPLRSNDTEVLKLFAYFSVRKIFGS